MFLLRGVWMGQAGADAVVVVGVVVEQGVGRSLSALLGHRDIDLVLGGAVSGGVVAGVGVAEDAHHGVVGEDTGEAFVGFGCAVGDDDLPGVLREADAYAAAVVEGDP